LSETNRIEQDHVPHLQTKTKTFLQKNKKKLKGICKDISDNKFQIHLLPTDVSIADKDITHSINRDGHSLHLLIERKSFLYRLIVKFSKSTSTAFQQTDKVAVSSFKCRRWQQAALITTNKRNSTPLRIHRRRKRTSSTKHYLPAL